MRIAMVSEHASPLAVAGHLGGADAGGQNVAVRALSLGLAAAGHDVVVHTRRTAGEQAPVVVLGDGVVVEHVDAGPARELGKDDLLEHMAAFTARLRERWADPARRPDVVHAHFWMSGLAALPAARAFGLPVVQTFHALGSVKRRHQGSADTSPAQRVARESDLGAAVDAVLATCSDEARELARLGVPRAHVRVVPCGVDVRAFRPEGPVAERGTRPRVLAVSRLVRRKGVGTVVEALAAVPDAELVVAGGPPRDGLDADPEVARLRAVAAHAGVTDRVRFLGAVDHGALPALLRSSDLVACVPDYEPFGLVPLEAMACGVPAVVAAVGGLADSVVDGRTGAHVPPGRPDALAAALRRLLADPVGTRALGRAGRRRVEERYGWDRVAAAHERVYRAVRERVLTTPQTVGVGS